MLLKTFLLVIIVIFVGGDIWLKSEKINFAHFDSRD